MKKLPFKPSSVATLGVELEFQLIDPITHDLIPRAKELIRHINLSKYNKLIIPEITQSMIEINSSIHTSVMDLYNELLQIRSFLLNEGNEIGIHICGGGTHPFQKWELRKIFPTKRFKNLSRQYQYLSKRSTVFGQHIHIGCESSEDALYLTHALARYIPQFIAISASSPFYQGVDTGYNTSRTTIFNSFPLSGVIPYCINWKEFSTYFYKMRNLGIISSMKDFYWDIRPKPEFGTVEIRVCDTPLTIEKAVQIAAYIQTISYYLLKTRAVSINPNLYDLYSYNRFQASRYGFDGDFIDSETLEHTSISDDISITMNHISLYATKLGNTDFISQLKSEVKNKHNDTVTLRNLYKEIGSLPKVVHEQCKMWAANNLKLN